MFISHYREAYLFFSCLLQLIDRNPDMIDNEKLADLASVGPIPIEPRLLTGAPQPNRLI